MERSLTKTQYQSVIDTGVQEALLVDDSRNLTITPILGEVTPLNKTRCLSFAKRKRELHLSIVSRWWFIKLYYTAVIQSKKHFLWPKMVVVLNWHIPMDKQSLQFDICCQHAPWTAPAQWEEDTNLIVRIFPAYPSTPDWNEPLPLSRQAWQRTQQSCKETAHLFQMVWYTVVGSSKAVCKVAVFTIRMFGPRTKNRECAKRYSSPPPTVVQQVLPRIPK